MKGSVVDVCGGTIPTHTNPFWLWVYIVREVPYFEAFGRPPLLQQLWSLAVEEQFYLLWPLILLFLLRISKSNRYGLLFGTFAMIALSTLWMAPLYSPDADPLRIYYGTDTRAAGFLVGAMVAMIWSPRQPSRRTDNRFLEALGWAGLLALFACGVKLSLDRNASPPERIPGESALVTGSRSRLVRSQKIGTWGRSCLRQPAVHLAGGDSSGDCQCALERESNRPKHILARFDPCYSNSTGAARSEADDPLPSPHPG